MIALFIMIPAAAAFMIALAGKMHRRVPQAVSVLATGSLFILSIACIVMMAQASSAGRAPILIFRTGNWLPPAGIPLIIDALSAFMLAVMNLIAVSVAVYSISYVKKYTDTWKFYTLFMLMVSGINGVLLSGDIFNMYVFLEIAAISGYFLVAFGTEAEELEASFKYAVMGSVASIFILLGIAFLYSRTSTLNLAGIASAVSAMDPNEGVLLLISVLFLMGFGLKAALVPFHGWLPYAHSSAPAPISAMLSGVSIKVLGIYALARIFFNVIGMSPAVSGVIIALAVISMLAGSILAFGQTDIKRLFAYSSISQIGYVALGLGIGTPLGIMGALFHLCNHSVFKSLLFLNSGAIERVTGTRDLGRMHAVASEYPVVGYTNLIASSSICGIPPLGGFWSKLIIIFACMQAGRPALAFIAVAVSALTLAYYFKALTPALFGASGLAESRARADLPLSMAGPMLLLAVLSIIGFIMLMPNTANKLLKDASSVLSEGNSYARTVSDTFIPPADTARTPKARGGLK